VTLTSELEVTAEVVTSPSAEDNCAHLRRLLRERYPSYAAWLELVVAAV
jgi:hypothetical protein